MKKNILFQSAVTLSLLTAYSVAATDTAHAAEENSLTEPNVTLNQSQETDGIQEDGKDETLSLQSEDDMSVAMNTSANQEDSTQPVSEIDSFDTTIPNSQAAEKTQAENIAPEGQEETLTTTIGLQTVPLSKEKPEVAPVPKRNEPNRVTTTMNEHPESSMSFNWFTTDEFDDAEVLVADNEKLEDATSVKAETLAVENQYAERTKDGAMIFEAEADTGETGYFLDSDISDQNMQWRGHRGEDVILQNVPETIYSATIDGLEPDTKYYFKVGSKKGGYSSTGSFKTAAAKDEPFTFIHYTDTQNAYWNENAHNEARYGAETLAHAIEANPDVAFALHSGDIIEDSGVEDEWLDLLEQSKDSYLNMPQVFISGNHDTGYDSADKQISRFRGHTNAPAANDADNSGTYYSLDYNGAHIVVLNTNDNTKDEEDNPEGAMIGKDQLQWFKDDVTKARENGANWIIVSYHKPLFSGSYHSLQDSDVAAGRDALMQAIDELDVDLVLNGHDHVLSRTLPLVYDADAFGKAKVDDKVVITTDEDGFPVYTDTAGTLFVVPGTAGTKNYDDLYNGSLEHIQEVRPAVAEALGDTPEEQEANLKYYRSLFDYMDEAAPSTGYQHNHDNWREGSAQQYALVSVTPEAITVETYQVKGDFDTGETRQSTLLDRFTIKKSTNSEEEKEDDQNQQTSAATDKDSHDERETNSDTTALEEKEEKVDKLHHGSHHSTHQTPQLGGNVSVPQTKSAETSVDESAEKGTTAIASHDADNTGETANTTPLVQGVITTTNSATTREVSVLPEKTVKATETVSAVPENENMPGTVASQRAEVASTLPQTGLATAGLGAGLMLVSVGGIFTLKKRH